MVPAIIVCFKGEKAKIDFMYGNILIAMASRARCGVVSIECGTTEKKISFSVSKMKIIFIACGMARN
jgi:hypothetical protein